MKRCDSDGGILLVSEIVSDDLSGVKRHGRLDSMRCGLILKIIVLFWSVNFLLHFVWEMLQVPLFKDMATMQHLEAVLICAKATVGDANIALAAYLAASVWRRSLTWMYPLSVGALIIYFVTGLVITVAFEYVATEVTGRWAYEEAMPTLPWVGTGILPILQWIVIPAVALAAIRLMYFGMLYAANAPSGAGRSRD
jgi:hypothetical protein